MDAKTIKSLVEDATAKWAKQRKAEERHASARTRRWTVMTRERPPSIKEAAWEVMEEAYMKASAGGKLPTPARMIFYAARPMIQEITGEPLTGSKYFTQKLLTEYMEENPETAAWRVVWDARGHLVEPHTNVSLPLGTLEVATYLRDAGDPQWDDPKADMPKINTYGPSGCYSAILFIEKEGFNEIFEAVQLAERYDIAIMSTKGTSVTAARHLADELCGDYDIPLLVLHDFDKSGLTILKTLREDTDRYTFCNDIEVIDLGLRLADVIAEGLAGEDVAYAARPGVVRWNLHESGAFSEEITYLMKQRVELNAFTADALVKWVEKKLDEHGIKKVVPDTDTLAHAYRREKQFILTAGVREAVGSVVGLC
jgi:Topoisomerase 6 subunit A/Spo11, Toprim domain